MNLACVFVAVSEKKVTSDLILVFEHKTAVLMSWQIGGETLVPVYICDRL